MLYYLKKCGSQELGSVINDKPQRGRYLFTSKNDAVLEMFPPLSSVALNDSAILPIIPLYSGKKVYCNFVYHNDKLTDNKPNGRNEYRIYLNRELEENKLLFKADDIVVMRKDNIEFEEETETVYFLDLLQDPNVKLYNELDNIIGESGIKGGYGLKDGEIPEFEEKVKRISTSFNRNVVIDDTVTKRIEETPDSIANLFTPVSFRDFVMAGYESLCAVTGTVIRCDAYMNLEAAHIKPKSHGGSNMPNNGLALSRDMHWAFDKGFFTLDKEFKVVVHPKTTSEWLLSFNGKPIRLPKDPFFRPAVDNIEYHSKNIYGMFLISGRL
jgi:hypothetical protein